MTTSNRSQPLKGVVSGEGFLEHDSVPVNDATAHINQGDLVYWDSSAHIAKPLDTDGHAATLLGVALKASIINSNIDNSSQSSQPDITVGYGAVADMFTTASEVYAHGVKLYAGADAQTVTNVAGSNPVGVVQLKSGQAAPTGGSGVKVNVLVYSAAFVKFLS